MVDLEALARLALVVQAGSFSGAARELGVSRQAVQRAIDRLEREHGVKLLERTTRSLRLTDAGRRLVVIAEDVRRSAREAQAVLLAATETPRGRLAISGPPLFADVVLSEVVPRFLARHPQVRIEGHFVAAGTDLHRDDVDLVVRIGAPPPPEAYARRLGTGRVLLVASPAYLGLHGGPTCADQLLLHQLLSYGPVVRPWQLRGPEGELSLPVEPRLQSDSASACVAAALADLGILKVPELAIRQQLADGALVQVLPDYAVPDADVWVIYGHRSSNDPTLAAFLEVLAAADW